MISIYCNNIINLFLIFAGLTNFNCQLLHSNIYIYGMQDSFLIANWFELNKQNQNKSVILKILSRFLNFESTTIIKIKSIQKRREKITLMQKQKIEQLSLHYVNYEMNNYNLKKRILKIYYNQTILMYIKSQSQTFNYLEVYPQLVSLWAVSFALFFYNSSKLY